MVEVTERAGLTSWELFFLDRPGPFVERPEAVDFRVGLFGEASREAAGEFTADVPCLDCSFFVAGSEVVEELREGLDAFDVLCSGVSTGCAVSFVAPETEVEVLLSMMATFFFGYEEDWTGSWGELYSRSHLHHANWEGLPFLLGFPSLLISGRTKN